MMLQIHCDLSYILITQMISQLTQLLFVLNIEKGCIVEASILLGDDSFGRVICETHLIIELLQLLEVRMRQGVLALLDLVVSELIGLELHRVSEFVLDSIYKLL